MEQQEVIKLRGAYRVVLGDLEGNVIEEIKQDNVVVTVGRAFVLNQLASSLINTARTLSHIAVGTSTSAPATSDTALGSENTRIAVASYSTGGLTNNPPSLRWEASFATNQANTTLGEIGLFNSSSGGTMFSRATFGTINKTTSNTLAVSYTVTN